MGVTIFRLLSNSDLMWGLNFNQNLNIADYYTD
jgi:hypothetical protein